MSKKRAPGNNNNNIAQASDDNLDDGFLNRDASGARAPIQVLPHLYVSNAQTATSETFLKRENITVLINLSKDVENAFKEDPKYEYHNFEMEDEEGFKISPFFRKIYDIISDVKTAGKKCLLYAEDGFNLVTTLAVAYMLYSSKKQDKYLPLEKALVYVSSKEPSLKPSLDFLEQLVQLEKALFDECSVRLSDIRGNNKNKNRR